MTRPLQTSCPVCTYHPKPGKARHTSCTSKECTWHTCPACKATWDWITGRILTIGPDATKKGSPNA